MSENNLPAIQELELSPEEAFKHDQFKLILNAPIPSKWIKKHPFARNVNYLPIDKVEFLLDRIFQQWRVEIIDTKQLFNAVMCHVRLHYKNPISGELEFHDGVGAVEIQTEKGASPADMSKINNQAVMKALPAAKSYAIKDAAEHLGDLFGRNLNRAETVAFKGSRTNVKYNLETLIKLHEEKRDKLNPEDDMNMLRIIDFKETLSYKKAINILLKL
jgi:hypothetical protein